MTRTSRFSKKKVDSVISQSNNSPHVKIVIEEISLPSDEIDVLADKYLQSEKLRKEYELKGRAYKKESEGYFKSIQAIYDSVGEEIVTSRVFVGMGKGRLKSIVDKEGLVDAFISGNISKEEFVSMVTFNKGDVEKTLGIRSTPYIDNTYPEVLMVKTL